MELGILSNHSSLPKYFDIKSHNFNEWKKRGENIASYKTKNGESFSELEQRVIPYFDQVIKKENNLLIVTHAGVIRVILAKIMNIPLKDIFTIKQGYGALNTLSYEEGNLTIISTNIVLE